VLCAMIVGPLNASQEPLVDRARWRRTDRCAAL
jgi:hypothetical protein